jgi:translocation and assembly module TamB
MARRGMRGLWLALAVAAGFFLLLAVAAWGFSRSDTFRSWLVTELKAQVHQATGARLELSSLGGSLLFDAQAQGVALVKDGRRLLSVERLELSYNPLALLGGRVKINSLVAVRPVVDLPWDFPAGQGGAGLAVTLSHLSVTGGSLSAGGGLGPLQNAREVELTGRFSLDQRGLKARVRVERARLGLEGMERPLTLKLAARLDGERLRVESLQLSDGASRVKLEGRASLKEPYRLKARLSAPHLETAALPFAWPFPEKPEGPMALELTLEGPWRRLKVAGALKQEAQTVPFQGWLALDGGAMELTGRLQGVRLASWGLPVPAAVEGGWRLASRIWPGMQGSQATLALDLSRASCQGISAGPVKLEARLADDALLINSLALTAGWGRLAGQGRLTLPAGEQPLRLEGSLAFNGLKPPRALAGELPPWLTQAVLNGRASAAGTLQELSLEVQLEPSQVAQGLEITSLAASGGRKQGAWRVERLELQAPLASLEARGWAQPGAASLSFKLGVPDIAALSQALSEAEIAPPVILSGSLEAQGQISGPWERPGLKVRLSARHLLSRHVLARQVRMEADLKGLGGSPQGWVSMAAEGWISGEIFLERVAVRAEFDGGGGNVVLQAQGPETGLALRLDSRDLLSLPLKAKLSKAWIRRGLLGRWEQQGSAQVLLGREEVRIKSLELKQGSERMSLEADFRPAGNEVSARLKLQDILLSRLLGQRPNLPAGARLEGSAKVEGLLNQPRLEINGRIRGLEWPGMEPTRVEFRGNYDNDLLRIAGRVYYGQREVMDLEGRAGLTISLRPPVWETTAEGIRLKASARELPLALAAPLIPVLDRVQGRARLDLEVDGSFDRPNLRGRLQVSGGKFIVATSGQIVDHIELDLALEGARLVVNQARALSDGELRISGQLTLPLGGPGGLDLHLTSSNLLVLLGTMGQLDASAEVRLGGDFSRPVLTGRVDVSDIVVRYGLAEPAGMADVVVLKPGHKPPPLEKKAKRFKLPPRLDGLKVDLTAALGNPTRVNLDDGWLDATGGVHLTKQPGQPLIFNGAVFIRKGRMIIAGKRFEVLEGKMDFQGKQQPDPALSAEVRLQMGSTTVFVSVAGTAQDPSVNLSSLPPMSQADILSSIIFGRPAAELSKGQSKELSAQALALLGQVGRKEMSKIFGPDLSPDVVTVYNTPSAGPSLEAGKYLSEDLYLRYRQNLGPYGGQNVGLEYRFSRYFSVESTVGNTRDNGVDLIFTRDFDFSFERPAKPDEKTPRK